jgi:hypothetical protein
MAGHSDNKNYYRILGVPPGVSSEEVKRAYRKLAKELHPDRHPNDPSATAKFQALNEAHTVLSDPVTRAGYDAACISADNPTAQQQPIAPVTCSSCGAVSAQPRYIIFWYVISLIFVTSSRTMQGVFCPSCAQKKAIQKKAIQASAITWLLGWWGFPWGPIWTIRALYRNLLNGTQPPDASAQILGRQALFFWEKGKLELAAATVDQALRFESSATLREHLSKLKEAMPPTPKTPLIDRWKLLRRWAFWAQLAAPLALVALVMWNFRSDVIIAIAQQKLAHVAEIRSGVLAEPRPGTSILATVRPFEDFHVLAGWGAEGYERVITGHGIVGYISKNSITYGDGMADLRGRCFPSGPVYLSNRMIFRQTGTGPHELTTINGLSSDAVVKLRDSAKHTVLSFYVKAHDEATIDTVPEGTFVIEFATGQEFSPVCGYFLSNMATQRYVEAAIFKTQIQGNDQYARAITITLNPVVGGTAKTVSTDDSTFDRD